MRKIDEEIIKLLLKQSKYRYSAEWEQVQRETFDVLTYIRSFLKKKSRMTPKDIEHLKEIIHKLAKKTGINLFKWGPSPEELSEFLNDSDLRQFLLFIENVKDINSINRNTSETVDKLIKNREGLGLPTITNFLFLFNPHVFIPLSETTIPTILKKAAKIKHSLTFAEYLELIKTIKQVSDGLGIVSMAEATFYLQKFWHDFWRKGWSGYTLLIEGNLKTFQEYAWFQVPDDFLKWFDFQNYEEYIELIHSLRIQEKSKVLCYDNATEGIIGYRVIQQASILTGKELRESLEEMGIKNGEIPSSGLFVMLKLSDMVPFENIISCAEVKRILKSFEKKDKSISPFIKIPDPIQLKLRLLIEDPTKHSITDRNDTKSQTLHNYLTSRGYYYSSHIISQFYTALKTKGFVILSGLTGTGKTKIVQELIELLDPSKKNFLFLSVRPDWRDSKALLGYYNPLTEAYHKTTLLEFILRAVKDYEDNRGEASPYFILLDEMNLAHVEYYFADFLSVLESGRDNDKGFTLESIKLHDVDEIEEKEGIPKELFLPPNLYIIGTVNMDETTYSFSPKVLDRAFTVEFHDVELNRYPPEGESKLSSEVLGTLREIILEDLRGRDGQFLAHSKGEINEAVRRLKDTQYWEILIDLNRALEPYELHFGYRVVDEVALFFKNAKESQEKKIVEFEREDEIFDLALLMKVLPKFHGNRKKLEEPLKVVLKLCLSESSGSDVSELKRQDVVELLRNWETQKEKFRFKHTARKTLRMLRQLYEIGFASFS